MKIERINSYTDPRFDKDILLQHGAFVLEESIPCSFAITGRTTARIDCPEDIDLTEAIEEYRFYTPHIVTFTDGRGRLIRQYPEPQIISLTIKEIQPSQFYASEEKIAAISTFIHSEEDIIVQIGVLDGKYVSLDGHTRLAYAVQKGMDHVYGCVTEDMGGYISGFVEEARKRGIYTPYDIQIISQKEYEIQWNQFCDDYFARKRAEKGEVG